MASELTEEQTRILTGLSYLSWAPISASEAAEIAPLKALGCVAVWEASVEDGAGDGQWIAIWRITPAGLSALASPASGEDAS